MFFIFFFLKSISHTLFLVSKLFYLLNMHCTKGVTNKLCLDVYYQNLKCLLINWLIYFIYVLYLKIIFSNDLYNLYFFSRLQIHYLYNCFFTCLQLVEHEQRLSNKKGHIAQELFFFILYLRKFNYICFLSWTFVCLDLRDRSSMELRLCIFFNIYIIKTFYIY